MKGSFLAVDDYGMGGIWMYIDAASPEEIVAVYPELKVFEEPPAFLSGDDLERIQSELHYDLADPPSGYLAELVAARTRRDE